MVSIRSLHQSTGRLIDHSGNYLGFWVSIRSLHQSTGRSPISLLTSPASEFQSAPCTRVQGDLSTTSRHPPSSVVSIRSLHQSTGRCNINLPIPFNRRSFNPLPAPEYREIEKVISVDVVREVSIRSLHQSTGRSPCHIRPLSFGVRFQSAPCTRVQGDVITDYNQVATKDVSIRSLHQSTGRLHARSGSKPQ